MKKVLIFSLGPIFKDYVHGGSQKVLREVSIHLGSQGHEVNIFCVERDDNNKIFKLGKYVTVYPKLKFKQTFPASYKTFPFNLWKVIETLNEQIKKHDIFYIHDGGLNFYDLCNRKIPTIISLRDFLYPETLSGAFNFKRDIIIVNSLHTLESLKYTVGNYIPSIEKRTVLIENGINLKLFKRKNPKKIIKLIDGVIKENDKIILYPHRPDPSKGIFQSLQLIYDLKHKKGWKNLKLLIPHYLDEEVTGDLGEHYKNIRNQVEELNLNNNILFHKWIPYELMPDYYSLGNLTLSVGNFIEAFGSNVGLESLACGTPVIMSLVGAQRYTLPEGVVPKVAYGDRKKTLKIADNILKNGSNFDSKKMRNFIRSNFSHDLMLKKYEKIIVNSKIKNPLKVKFDNASFNNQIKIAPWACLTKKGIYSDYEYKYYDISKELKKFLDNYNIFFLNQIKGKLKKEILELIEKGILVYKK